VLCNFTLWAFTRVCKNGGCMYESRLTYAIRGSGSSRPSAEIVLGFLPMLTPSLI